VSAFLVVAAGALLLGALLAPGTVVHGRARGLATPEPSPSAGAPAPLGLRLALTSVAAAVRAGGTPASAWTAVGVPVDARDSPEAAWTADLALADLVGAGRNGAPARGRSWLRRSWPVRSWRRPSSAARVLAEQQAIAVTGACAVAGELGAPLAEVLDELASTVADHRESFDARSGALAGPRASAQVLGWLPVVTLLGAALLGAQPWRTATDGGLGALAAALGLLLLVAGRRWTTALVARAERAGARSVSV